MIDYEAAAPYLKTLLETQLRFTMETTAFKTGEDVSNYEAQIKELFLGAVDAALGGTETLYRIELCPHDSVKHLSYLSCASHELGGGDWCDGTKLVPVQGVVVKDES